jgi:hypothetical protein
MNERRRPNIVVPIVGAVLIVAGVAIWYTQALSIVSFGVGRFSLVPVPVNAFPSWEFPLFVNYSTVAGVVLVFIGAIMIAAWWGYARGLRIASTRADLDRR